MGSRRISKQSPHLRASKSVSRSAPPSLVYKWWLDTLQPPVALPWFTLGPMILDNLKGTRGQSSHTLATNLTSVNSSLGCHPNPQSQPAILTLSISLSAAVLSLSTSYTDSQSGFYYYLLLSIEVLKQFQVESETGFKQDQEVEGKEPWAWLYPDLLFMLRRKLGGARGKPLFLACTNSIFPGASPGDSPGFICTFRDFPIERALAILYQRQLQHARDVISLRESYGISLVKSLYLHTYQQYSINK